jgi:hypothetical protein
LPKKVTIVTSSIYSTWKEYFDEFKCNGGVIEACPTKTLSGISNSTAQSFLIEPDGTVEFLYSYEKLNYRGFRSIGSISPKEVAKVNSYINKTDLEQINKLGAYLYERDIIGYITIDYITYIDGLKVTIYYNTSRQLQPWILSTEFQIP